ncbi:uncharacterized protein PpBr36_06038 [Pyricularia pennisetigena]|uniref:uncharacterized protein n=1 Tax=Pyricularia pennisetigena TaxID=1578925 RepID=UPI0011534CBB|nr:uncharacterized protein PpBr36_06038 [Pyricularia pennisetigena]TLS23746.1 hypothetical protein PpBr36_06038 [Pyricularia pennisetigena]
MPPTMWTGPPSLPVFSVDRLARRNNKSSATSAPTSPPLPSPRPPPSSSVSGQYHSQNLADLLEPAIDGPPSPESIRALSQQVRQTFTSSPVQATLRNQQTSPGSTSSLQSLNYSDCPPWEHSFDAPYSAPPQLSRKSSGRSESGKMQHPARERTDSVQIFGKALFNRKPKSNKRDSSTYSSSGSSSIYSQDIPLDTANPPLPVAIMNLPTANHSIPSLFTRRKNARDSLICDSDVKRKYTISAPYNFQHLAHSERDGQSGMETANRLTMQTDDSLTRASRVPSGGSLVGINAGPDSPVNSSDEHLGSLDEHTEVGVKPTPVSPMSPVFPVSPVRRRYPLIKVRSRELMEQSPPRHAKLDETTPPVPPPRVSSRVSLRHAGLESICASANHDRPQTSGGISQTSQRSTSPDQEDDYLHMRKNSRESNIVPAEFRFSRVIPPAPNTNNWPLACPPGAASPDALPDVPEEEEHAIKARSRASIISRSSSLRASKSAPMLWQVGTSSQRPSSIASDTLGRLDMSDLAVQCVPGVDSMANESLDLLLSDSWEDDIDYCYEHEAEADCNYAWDRPSLDISREDDNTTPIEFDYNDEHLVFAQGYLRPVHFDVPALSPVSQVSRDSTILMEAITPVTPAAPMTSANFSLPRSDIQKQASRRQVRKPPQSSSNYNESQGFDLSPTMIIPNGEFQRQVVEEPEWYPGQDDVLTTRSPYSYEEPTLNMDKSALFVQSRVSASTVNSMGSDFTSSDRHASTSTTFTRLTASTSSINVQGLADQSTDTLSTVSPENSSDDSMNKLTKQRKEEQAPTLTRQRAKTLSHAQMAYSKPSLQPNVQHYAAYTMSVSRI